MRVFSSLPPVVCYFFAAISVLVTYFYYENDFAVRKAKLDAARMDAPAAIAIQDFQSSEPTQEVVLQAQIRGDWTQQATLRGDDGPEPGFVNFLVAPSASKLGNNVLGVVSFTERQAGAFAEWLQASEAGKGPLGPIFELNGLVSPLPSEQAEALTGFLAESGVSVSENLVNLRPFLEGRAAAYAPEPASYRGYVVGGIIALLLSFSGYLNSIDSSAAARRPRVEAVDVMSKLVPAETGTADKELAMVPPASTSKADPDSPLGRIQAKARSETLEI